MLTRASHRVCVKTLRFGENQPWNLERRLQNRPPREKMLMPLSLLLAGLLAGRPPMQVTAADSRVTTAADSVAAATELPLRIDGEWYDVSGWADEHPGGRWLLEYARGRDVTALFHAIHMKNSNKVSAVLQRLPQLDSGSLRQPSKPVPFPTQQAEEGALQGPYVLAGLDGKPAPETPPLPPIDSPLRRELAAMLRREFPTPASSKASPAHWARTLVALAGTLGCWQSWGRRRGARRPGPGRSGTRWQRASWRAAGRSATISCATCCTCSRNTWGERCQSKAST